MIKATLMHSLLLGVYILKTIISKFVPDSTRHIQLSFSKLALRKRRENDFFVRPTKHFSPNTSVNICLCIKGERIIARTTFWAARRRRMLVGYGLLLEEQCKILRRCVPIIPWKHNTHSRGSSLSRLFNKAHLNIRQRHKKIHLLISKASTSYVTSPEHGSWRI